jgi:hypothetical protein
MSALNPKDRAAWCPLDQGWRWTHSGDPKFDGLALASSMGVRTPEGALVRWTPGVSRDELAQAIRDAFDWLVETCGRPLGASDADGVPLLLSLRFGDKHEDPRLPPSVGYIGAAQSPFAEEFALQRAQLYDFLGARCVPAPPSPLDDVVASAWLVASSPQVPVTMLLLQRTACGLGLPRSGHGTAYTRHPHTWADEDYGRYAWGLSGRSSDQEMSGGARRDGQPVKRELAALATEAPAVHRQLRAMFAAIEAYWRDVRFVEFVVERGQVFVVQITPRKRTPRDAPPAPRALEPATVGAPIVVGSVSGGREGFALDGVVLALASNVPELARAAVAPTALAGAGAGGPPLPLTWLDEEPPRLPLAAGAPVDLVRSANGRHMVGRWFEADQALRVDREDAVIVRSGDGLVVLGRARVRGGAGYLLSLAARGCWRAVLERAGHVLIHAACVEIDGRAVLLLGRKGAGKTTLQLALIARGARFLSADRCFLSPDGRVTPWPGSLRLQRDTFEALAPDLREMLLRAASGWSPSTNKLAVPFVRAVEVLGGGVPRPPGATLCVAVDPSGGGLTPLDAPAAARVLDESVFRAATDAHPPWVQVLLPHLAVPPEARVVPLPAVRAPGGPPERAAAELFGYLP